jgi:hypothetical protein
MFENMIFEIIKYILILRYDFTLTNQLDYYIGNYVDENGNIPLDGVYEGKWYLEHLFVDL